MQSVLGFAQYFRDFIREPYYSELTAPLTDMTRVEFDWDESKWVVDYRSALTRLKEACAASFKCIYPDFESPWHVYVDASKRAFGGSLIQEKTIADGTTRQDVVAVVSKKFSDVATRWDVIKRECYAIYYVVLSLAYYLRYKPFVIHTDHQNLQYMQKSKVAIIMRWVLLLQSFPIQAIVHVEGKQNILGDFWTRAGIDTAEEEEAERLQLQRVQSHQLQPVQSHRLQVQRVQPHQLQPQAVEPEALAKKEALRNMEEEYAGEEEECGGEEEECVGLDEGAPSGASREPATHATEQSLAHQVLIPHHFQLTSHFPAPESVRS